MSGWNYLSTISWFSEGSTRGKYNSVKDAMRAHYKYITDEQRDDFVAIKGLKWEDWKELADFELGKRINARVAGKFVVALPNSLSEKEAFELIEMFLQEAWGINKYTIALHRNKARISGEDNFHAHVIFYTRKPDGKKIRVPGGKQGASVYLRNLREKWFKLLETRGYKRVEAGQKSERIPWVDLIKGRWKENVRLELELRKYLREIRKLTEEAQREVENILSDLKSKDVFTSEKGRNKQIEQQKPSLITDIRRELREMERERRRREREEERRRRREEQERRRREQVEFLNRLADSVLEDMKRRKMYRKSRFRRR